MNTNDFKIGVIGLGYVGLPVAFHMAKKFQTIGFDIKKKRIDELKDDVDVTGEIDSTQLKSSSLMYTGQIEDLKECNFYIVTVPTPVNSANQPDLSIVYKATESVGSVLKKGDIVVYESTVYPGVTEEECVPILARVSGLKSGIDFKVGYSPERINPGDHEHSFDKITKVVSAEDSISLEKVSYVYSQVVTAGIFKAQSIRVAEASKVIENSQRDINIAFVNELSLIFDRLNIDTKSVLEAAQTKWNFLKFSPGLVGGHCIGVDPFYLTHKAEKEGYFPQVILSGRRINDDMGRHVASKAIEKMILKGVDVCKANVTILGLTFKENCPDIRNSKVVDIANEFKRLNIKFNIYDPHADPLEVKEEYGVSLTSLESLPKSEVIVLAVSHREFLELGVSKISEMLCGPRILVDVKGIFGLGELEEHGIDHWRL